MGTESATSCPHCNVALCAVEDKGIPFLGCEKCLGVFVSEPDLFGYVERADAPSVFASFVALHVKMIESGQPGSKRKCPRCASSMARVPFGDQPLVVLDRCQDHGIWFDRGEIQKTIRSARTAAGVATDPHLDPDDDGPMRGRRT